MKKKIIWCSVIVVCTCLIICVAILMIKRNAPIEHYEYPQSRYAQQLLIPDDVLEKMTDKALVQAIVEYPLLIDYYAINNLEKRLEIFSKQCNALKELMSRESAKENLWVYGRESIEELSKEPEKNDIAISVMKDIINSVYDDVFE